MPRIIDLYYDVTNQYLFDPVKGTKLPSSALPWIRFREKPVVNLRLYAGSSTATPYTGLDATWAFSAAIDNDWDHSTDPMCKTLDAGINVAGDWAGGNADAAAGQLSIRLDADTAEYEEEVDAALTGEIRHTRMEVKAYDGTPDLVWSDSFSFRCYNLLDDDGSTTPATPANHYTMAEVDALIAGIEAAVVHVADFASLPASPTDGMQRYIDAYHYLATYDATAAKWFNPMGGEVDAQG